MIVSGSTLDSINGKERHSLTSIVQTRHKIRKSWLNQESRSIVELLKTTIPQQVPPGNYFAVNSETGVKRLD